MTKIDDEIAQLKARLAQLEALKAGDSPAGQEPPTATPSAAKAATDERSTRIGLAAVVITFALVVLVLLAMPGPKGQTSEQASGTATATPQGDVAAPVEAASTPRDPWTYDDLSDPMSDAKGRTACTTSLNEVHLEPPYSNVPVLLCVRRSPRYGLDVIASLLGDGQILCNSYEDCSVQVRFDDKPSRRQGAVGAADNSSNVVFLRGAKGIVESLKGAQKFRLELPLYQAGSQTVEFDVTGLKWE